MTLSRRRFFGLAAATGLLAATDPNEYVRRLWTGWRPDTNATARAIIDKFEATNDQEFLRIAGWKGLPYGDVPINVGPMTLGVDMSTEPAKTILVAQLPDGRIYNLDGIRISYGFDSDGVQVDSMVPDGPWQKISLQFPPDRCAHS